jgi:sugar/nucleoside kinase (ribokinase family)
MERHFRNIPGFKEWAMNIDIIQANQNELKTLSNKNRYEDIITEVLSYGPRYFVLTLEDRGAGIYFMENDNIKSIHMPAIEINAKNKVGCGDVFGAVFFYSYISSSTDFPEHLNIFKALKLANIAAGCSASYNVISEFKNMKKDVISRID